MNYHLLESGEAEALPRLIMVMGSNPISFEIALVPVRNGKC
jgi:hypothetical protein